MRENDEKNINIVPHGSGKQAASMDMVKNVVPVSCGGIAIIFTLSKIDLSSKLSSIITPVNLSISIS